MLNLHTIKVKYIGATNIRGSRVKLISERFEDSFTLPYDYAFNSAVDIAADWLEKNGFKPCFKSEGKDYMMIHCFVFEPFKGPGIAAEEFNYYEKELERVTGNGEVNVTFSADETETRNMNINYDSSRAIIEWLARGV